MKHITNILVMFKGKIINRFAHIRSRQIGVAASLGPPFLVGLFASSDYLVYIMMLPVLTVVLFYFLFRSKLKELNVVKGYLEMDERNIMILSADQDQVTEIPISDVTRLTFEHTASIPDNKWYQIILDIFGTIKHPTLRFEYEGSRHEFFFTIESFFMHKKLKTIQDGLRSPTVSNTMQSA